MESEDDPTLAKIAEQLSEIDYRLAVVRENAKEPLLSKVSADYLRARTTLVARAAIRQQELKSKLQRRNRVNLDPVIAELKSRIEILAAEEDAAVKDVDEQRRKAERVGNSSIDVEMMRSELQYLDKVLAPIADEREKLKVEFRSARRISVIQRAERPQSADGKQRLLTTAGAGFGGLFGAVFLVLLADVRKQRINSLVDLSRGLGLTVVGAVPLMPRNSLGAPADHGHGYMVPAGSRRSGRTPWTTRSVPSPHGSS